eukprot:1194677-Prorocentrum_lima.AAC.1
MHESCDRQFEKARLTSQRRFRYQDSPRDVHALACDPTPRLTFALVGVFRRRPNRRRKFR